MCPPSSLVGRRGTQSRFPPAWLTSCKAKILLRRRCNRLRNQREPENKVSQKSDNTSLGKAGIRFRTVRASSAAKVLSYSDGPTLVWAIWSEQAVPAVIDPGWISTTASDLPGYNDCNQYKVDGSMTYEIGLTEKVLIGPTLYSYPVDISRPGKRSLWISKSSDRKTQWFINITAVSEFTRSVKVDSNSYRLVSGVWKPTSSYHGTPQTLRRPRLSLFYSIGSENSINPQKLKSGVRAAFEFSKFEYDVVLRRAGIDFGDLANEAAKSIRSLDINSIAYLRDFIEIGKLTRSITSITELSGTLTDFIHKISGFYLGNHYGTRLTIKDTEKIAKAIDKIDLEYGTQSMFASESAAVEYGGNKYDVTYWLSGRVQNVSDDVLHETETINQAIDQLKNRITRIGLELDILPTFENIWDLIPYSFVLDWFVPIGKTLEHREETSYMQSLPVEDVFMSIKVANAIDDTRYVQGGVLHTEISRKYYVRNCTSRLPLPKMHIEAPKGAQSHWLEASAILLQAVT
uniref:Phage maturation protein n=1 Tax=ssRNA phage DC TaxID=1892901 RepID=A0A1B3Q5U7_9VIRU|nr:phage maturation protein [ssRNA phage DC]